MTRHGLARFLPRIFKVDQKLKAEENATEEETAKLPRTQSKTFICRAQLLDDTQLTFNMKTSSKGHLLLCRVCEHLNIIDEREYFGLRFIDESEQSHWLDLSKSLRSQIKDCNPCTFYFGVKFYAVDPCKLQEEIARYQFFLQLKRDLLQGRLPVNFELSVELCSYAIQSELGDFDPKVHTDGYVSEFRFTPTQNEKLEKHIAMMHPALIGQVPSMAEYKFMDKVKWLDMYGVDLHPVKNESGQECYLGVTPTGIIVYRQKHKIANYFWPRITKIHMKSKRFVLRVRDKLNMDNSYTFDCASKSAGRNLWRCAVDHHAFFRACESHNAQQQANEGLFFNLRHRYSHRRSHSTNSTPKKHQQHRNDLDNVPSSAVVRTPSKRYRRRLSATSMPSINDAAISKQTPSDPLALYGDSERTILKKRYCDGYTSAPETKWENSTSRKQPMGSGMFTTGRQSPMSMRSERMLFPMRSLSHNRKPDSRYNDETSTIGAPSDAENNYNRRRNCSGSESEAAGNMCRRTFTGDRRQSRRSMESLTYTESQWRENQYRMQGGNMGSQTSMASTVQSLAVAQARRRRRRSRSPAANHGGGPIAGGPCAPQELAQHFRYIDPEQEGLSVDQLKDIEYTVVHTEQSKGTSSGPHAPMDPRRPNPPSSTKLVTSKSEVGMTCTRPQGEAPPPYTSFIEEPTESHYNQRSISTSSLKVVDNQFQKNRPADYFYHQNSNSAGAPSGVDPTSQTSGAAPAPAPASVGAAPTTTSSSSSSRLPVSKYDVGDQLCRSTTSSADQYHNRRNLQQPPHQHQYQHQQAPYNTRRIDRAASSSEAPPGVSASSTSRLTSARRISSNDLRGDKSQGRLVSPVTVRRAVVQQAPIIRTKPTSTMFDSSSQYSDYNAEQYVAVPKRDMEHAREDSGVSIGQDYHCHSPRYYEAVTRSAVNTLNDSKDHYNSIYGGAKNIYNTAERHIATRPTSIHGSNLITQI